METYMRNEYQKLKDDDEITSLIENVKLRNKTVEPLRNPTSKTSSNWGNRSDYDPPMIPSDNDLKWENSY